MMVFLQGVLEAQDVTRARAGLEGVLWRDGKATAGPAARAVKQNEQAAGADAKAQALEKFVADALRRHAVFALAARPRRLSRVLFSRYAPGMTYGSHTDDALMGDADDPLRTDLAFTLFLTDPQTYSGGELWIESAAGQQAVKLAAGDAVLYPAGTIHRVAPVTEGVRLAAVGWVQSLVRDPARREVLFDLATARARLTGAGDDLLLLDKSLANLLRMWSEP